MHSFQIEGFRKESFSLLGSGVWGDVYDLDDGTVLKLARQKAGIGDGNHKVQHEIQVMRALYDCSLTVNIPRHIDSGFISDDLDLAKDGYSIWSRMTKVAGRGLKIVDIAKMPEEDKKNIGYSMAEASHEITGALREVDFKKPLQSLDILDCLDGMMDLFTPDDQACIRHVLSLGASLDVVERQPIHGDFNLSNLLFDDSGCVVGVLDFAETRIGFVEEDISSLICILPFLSSYIEERYKDITGDILDHRRLLLGAIQQDVLGMILCRYNLGRSEEADACMKRLAERLEVFGAG